MSENAPRKPQRKKKQKGLDDVENASMTSLEYDLEELLRVNLHWPGFWEIILLSDACRSTQGHRVIRPKARETW
jgi:hypothetical protein